MKPVAFIGSARDDLRAFPTSAREDAGYQLYLVQIERKPDDWKPFPEIGGGVSRIRVRDSGGFDGVMFVVKFSDAVYVLHCFRNRTRKTSDSDIDLARKRYTALVGSLRQ